MDNNCHNKHNSPMFGDGGGVGNGGASVITTNRRTARQHTEPASGTLRILRKRRLIANK